MDHHSPLPLPAPLHTHTDPLTRLHEIDAHKRLLLQHRTLIRAEIIRMEMRLIELAVRPFSFPPITIQIPPAAISILFFWR